jgi:hypothetical protein
MGERMKSIRHAYYFLTAIVLAAFSPLASSAPAVCGQESHNGYSGEFDGRFYQVVVDAGISWDDAKTAAEAEEHEGVLGQLATINSFAEDEFVHCLIQATPGAAGKEAWIGGFQDTESDEPDEGWQWLNGELIDPDNITGSNYTNWQAGEPNDDTAPSGDERHLGASHGGNFGWNDEGRLANIGSYVVEFGDKAVPFDAGNCATPDGCPLGEDGPIIKYPAGTLTDNKTVELRSWTIDIGPGLCAANLPVGVIPPPVILDLVPEDGPVVIAPVYCSEDGIITVIRTETQVQVPNGIVQITGTNKYGTDANPHSCNRVDPPPPCDPTDQDIVVYRNTLASDQLEKAVESGVDPLFLGNVAETTNGVVNPPRGAGGKGSYFIEGLRIQFPNGYLFDENPAGHHGLVIALQRYKLKKGLAAVNAAKPALKPVEWLALRVLADAALYWHDRGHYDAALFKVKLLLQLNDKLKPKYKVIANKNPYGEVTYRYLNLKDMYERRLIPYD